MSKTAADDDIGPTSFVPDDFDDYNEMDMSGGVGEEEDQDAYTQMLEEQRAFEARLNNTVGQSTPRKLDFDAYGISGGGESERKFNTQTAATETQQLTQPASLSLAYDDDDDGDDEVMLQQQQQAASSSATHIPSSFTQINTSALSSSKQPNHPQAPQYTPSRPHPLATKSSAGAASVLPPLHRSISDLRAAVLSPEAKTYVFRRAPVVGEFVTVTNHRQERVYLTKESEVDAAKRLASHTKAHRTQQMHRELGQLNVRKLLTELDAEANLRAEKESRQLAETLQYASDEEDDERTRVRKRRQRKERLMKKLDEQAARQRISAKNTQLWVDKYAPTSYADLLSHEQINREVLEWLKGWDTCVFGAPVLAPGSAAAAEVTATRTLENSMLRQSGADPTKQKKKPPPRVISADGETDIRPEHRVILLTGPPGLGKTTLAHILAKQAGYHPYEINASDDRTAATLESKIRAATEMQSVSFGTEHRAKPNCVIIDEIDGVGAEGGELGAIDALLCIVNAVGKKAAKKDTSDSAGGAGGDDDGSEDEEEKEKDSTTAPSRRRARASDKKQSSAPGPLKRPIICICNDQYAAALRPLRQVARVFEFTASPKAKFVERLKYIAGKEGMEYDPRTLGALADVVEMDIRSALNMLQFVHSKGQRLTAHALNSLAIGRKDVEKSRRQIWDSVFCDQEIKKDHILQFRDMRETEQHNTNDKIVVSALDAKARELQGMLSDAGDFDKIMEGVFHNWPTVGFPDPTLSKMVSCAEWLAYADILDRRIQSEVEMSLMQYTPFAAIGIHHLTARPRRVMLEMPQMYYHAFVEHQRNKNILKSFLNPQNTLTLDGQTMKNTVLDVLPYTLDIIHPTIRAVNFVMLNQREKVELNNLIDTMLNLSVTYRVEVQNAFQPLASGAAWSRPADANAVSVSYKLEPPIDLLSQWTNPLESQTAAKFQPKDRYGNQSKFHKPQRPSTTPASTTSPSSSSSFHIDRYAMPNKVRQLVLHELNFEAMRRNEARIAERHGGKKGKQAADERKDGGKEASAVAESSKSLISPAVQRLLDEEQRKRTRAAAGATASPSSSAPKAEEDESPASKRAKLSASLNFLSKHADAVKNKRHKLRMAGASNSGKLDLSGLKTEKESKSLTPSSMDMSVDTPISSTPSTLPPIAPQASSVLSRFTHPLHFKYNEGCTNAVRRTVNVAHFLPL